MLPELLDDIQDDPVIKSLQPFHKKIARMLAEGCRNRDICRECRITGSRLSVLKTSPLMKRAIGYYEGIVEKGFEKARRKLDSGAEKAAEIIVDALNTTDAELTNGVKERVKIGFGLLDRLGVKQTEKRQEVVKGRTIFEQTLRLIKDESLDKSDEKSVYDKASDLMLDM